jgi:hypothetical protein
VARVGGCDALPAGSDLQILGGLLFDSTSNWSSRTGEGAFCTTRGAKKDPDVLELIKKDPKLQRQKKLIENILEKCRKKSQGKNPLFVCEKRGKGADREADLICKRPFRA